MSRCRVQDCQCTLDGIGCNCSNHPHQYNMSDVHVRVYRDRYINDRYNEFWQAQSLWSQETFGTDSERGPAGTILHLWKEVHQELIEINMSDLSQPALKLKNQSLPEMQMELVDCFFLVTDAARRSGLNYNQFMDLVEEKLKINKARKWNKPTSDQPVEHDRSGE